MYIFFSRLNPTILVFRPKYIFSSKLVFLKFPEFQLSYTRKFGTLWAVLQTARTNRCSYRLTVASFVVAIFQFFSSFFPAKKKRFRSSLNSSCTIQNVIYSIMFRLLLTNDLTEPVLEEALKLVCTILTMCVQQGESIYKICNLLQIIMAIVNSKKNNLRTISLKAFCTCIAASQVL